MKTYKKKKKSKKNPYEQGQGRAGQARQGKESIHVKAQLSSNSVQPHKTQTPLSNSISRRLCSGIILKFYLPYMEISCVDIYLYIEWIHSTSL